MAKIWGIENWNIQWKLEIRNWKFASKRVDFYPPFVYYLKREKLLRTNHRRSCRHRSRLLFGKRRSLWRQSYHAFADRVDSRNFKLFYKTCLGSYHLPFAALNLKPVFFSDYDGTGLDYWCYLHPALFWDNRNRRPFLDSLNSLDYEHCLWHHPG